MPVPQLFKKISENKLIKKILPILIIALVFFFLGKTVFSNYQKAKDYNFEFNLLYLALSFLFIVLTNFSVGITWKKILNILSPKNEITYLEAMKIEVYADFGKYIPGKIWNFLGVVYFGGKKNISKKIIFYSYFLQVVYGAISAVFLGLPLVFFSSDFFSYAALAAIFLFLGLLFFHKFLFIAPNYFLKKINKPRLENLDLPPLSIVKIFFYASLVRIISGLSFCLFIISIFGNSAGAIFSQIMGYYILANVAGTLAFFSPGGLGAKEGALTFFLKDIFTLPLASAISIAARIWLILGDVMSLLFVSVFFRKVKI